MVVTGLESFLGSSEGEVVGSQGGQRTITKRWESKEVIKKGFIPKKNTWVKDLYKVISNLTKKEKRGPRTRGEIHYGSFCFKGCKARDFLAGGLMRVGLFVWGGGGGFKKKVRSREL